MVIFQSTTYRRGLGGKNTESVPKNRQACHAAPLWFCRHVAPREISGNHDPAPRKLIQRRLESAIYQLKGADIMKKRFNETQIIGIFEGASTQVTDICRLWHLGCDISQRAKYGGMEVSDAKRLKAAGG
ncbi:MAG: hypothetical protein HRT36_01635 [Alphaproteobacteria bacterium]|nr:hypothetical protein [Alphaproteobacteria bacterium]